MDNLSNIYSVDSNAEYNLSKSFHNAPMSYTGFLGGSSTSGISDTPQINAYPNIFKLEAFSSITLKGTGFSPNSDVCIYNYELGFVPTDELVHLTTDNSGNFSVIFEYKEHKNNLLYKEVEAHETQNYFYLQAYNSKTGKYSNYIAIYFCW